MRAATILAIISGAAALSIRAECPTSAGSPCGTVQVLGQSVTYPKCDCKTTCSGPVSVGGISATVNIGVSSILFARLRDRNARSYSMLSLDGATRPSAKAV